MAEVDDREDRDALLLAEYRKGDTAAYGILYEKYQRFAFSVARQYASTPEQAENLVSEAFTRIMEAIRRGKGPTISMGHYLKSTIRNIAINSGGRDSREIVLDPEDLAKVFEREQFGDDVESPAWVAEAFNRLSPRSQYIVWNRVVEGVSSQKIAQSLGISGASITRAYQSALRSFREDFVTAAINESSNAECQQFAPMLRELASPRKRTLGRQGNPRLAEHLKTCPRCSAVSRRLGASNRTLLAIVFIAGVGELAKDSLGSTAAFAAAAPAGITIKTKIVAGCVFLAVGAGGMITASWNSGAPPAVAVETAINLGRIDPQEASLLTVGTCSVKRESAGEGKELWRLSSPGRGCVAQVDFIGSSDDSQKTFHLGLGTDQAIDAVEVARPGTWIVRLIDGEDTRELKVTVR